MIVKPCMPSAELTALEALYTRLPEDHPMRSLVEEERGKMRKSFRGEQNVFYYLNMIDSLDVYLFHNIILKDARGIKVQLDALFLTSSYLLNLESKNYDGILRYEAIGQPQREWNGQTVPYSCPVEQVTRHKYQLRSWLQLNRFPTFPVEVYAVIVNKGLKIISPNMEEIRKNVIYHKDILKTVEVLNEKHSPMISPQVLRKLSSAILQQHSPEQPDLLSKYKISQSELITGVECPNCHALPMNREYGSWHCLHCGHHSKTAHITALRDYALLIGQTITNQQARWFLRIESANVVKKILNQAKLTRQHNKRWRTYVIDYEKLNN